jgi:hypothetical protein
MTPAAARQQIRDRILALSPASTYVSSTFALGSAVWVESRRPLMPELSPTTLAPLAFTVDDRTHNAQPARPIADGGRVDAPITVRFLYPLRAAGPEMDDWDRSALAAEALWDWLLHTDWEGAAASDMTLETDPSRLFQRRIVGTSEDWILVEVYLRAFYTLS